MLFEETENMNRVIPDFEPMDEETVKKLRSMTIAEKIQRIGELNIQARERAAARLHTNSQNGARNKYKPKWLDACSMATKRFSSEPVPHCRRQFFHHN